MLETLTMYDWRNAAGFCKAVKVEGDGGIRSHGFVLTSGRDVGAEAAEEDDVPFDERFAALRGVLTEQFEEGRKLEALIANRLIAVDV